MKTKAECSIDDCDKPAKVRGLCSACYSWCRKVELMSTYHRKVYMENLHFRMKRMLSRMGISPGKVLRFKRTA